MTISFDTLMNLTQWTLLVIRPFFSVFVKRSFPYYEVAEKGLNLNICGSTQRCVLLYKQTVALWPLSEVLKGKLDGSKWTIESRNPCSLLKLLSRLGMACRAHAKLIGLE